MAIRVLRTISWLVFVALICGGAAGLYWRHNQGLPLLPEWANLPIAAVGTDQSDVHSDQPAAAAPADTEGPKILKLSPQARKNLQLVAKGLRPTSYWRKVQIPGVVVDRPGYSDRSIISPAVGIVTAVHSFPGDTVQPGQQLFTLRLISEYLQSSQKELFQATRETQLITERMERIRPLVEKAALPESEFIKLENSLRRQAALIQAHRQDLQTRGLSETQIADVARGEFVSTVTVHAPEASVSQRRPTSRTQTLAASLNSDPNKPVAAFEVQTLDAKLGQQVQVGQLLSTLADHSALYIEGHAFRSDAGYLEAATQASWPVTVEFSQEAEADWPPLEQQFQIRYLSSAIDADSRTFDFFIPLVNQARAYEREGDTFFVWRYRPGQRVRVHVPAQQMEDVFVLPASGVAHEGPEAYVFQQDGDLFRRVPVHVLHQDRLNIVLANDGSVTPGLYYAQNAAASLNRVLKAQSASGQQPAVHVHADGTVHAAH